MGKLWCWFFKEDSFKQKRRAPALLLDRSQLVVPQQQMVLLLAFFPLTGNGQATKNEERSNDGQKLAPKTDFMLMMRNKPFHIISPALQQK